MPPVVAAAAIGGAAALGGAAISSSATKKAANAQAQATQAQIAANQENRDYQYGLNAPTINAGNNATNLIGAFTGASGDPAAAAGALDTFRGSTGYQDLLKTGLNAVNSNAYARGMGNSGATLKALQAKGTSIADSSVQGWIGNLNSLVNAGTAARGIVANVGTSTTQGVNAATQAGADATGNAALINGNNWSRILAQLGGGAIANGSTASGFGSSGTSSGLAYNPQLVDNLKYMGLG